MFLPAKRRFFFAVRLLTLVAVGLLFAPGSGWLHFLAGHRHGLSSHPSACPCQHETVKAPLRADEQCCQAGHVHLPASRHEQEAPEPGSSSLRGLTIGVDVHACWLCEMLSSLVAGCDQLEVIKVGEACPLSFAGHLPQPLRQPVPAMARGPPRGTLS